ncbi:MAG TPA: nucleoside deaminase [Bacteroidales bacterium]|nr:nucleoside deaminase [Bacteroidales bacterium]HPT04753.1 nucleoside deaminase [Bacteroidales bacterium]
MNKSSETYMKEAIRLSKQNIKNGNGGPFGAVIVKDGKIIASGTNCVTSSNDPTAHAEVVAIRNACKTLNTFQLDDCEIYSSCEPCPMCLGAIYWARPKKIYFAASRIDAAASGFDDSLIYDEIALPIEHRKIESEQLLQEEAKSVFDDWDNLTNKIEY